MAQYKLPTETHFTEYRGFSIDLTSGGTFCAEIEGAQIHSDKYDHLTSDIDRILKDISKSERLSLPCISSHHEGLIELKITGVTPAHEMARGVPERVYNPVFADTHEVRAKLIIRKRVADQLEAIDKELDTCAIDTRLWNKDKPKTLPDKVRFLRESHEAAVTAAKKLVF
ncbi:hypothetical protein LCGC14_2461080 [marine sediment metagenome]|uniref:Uncharacterized protein n=1 Tax=marine sediment metagenome TaxID=412755 RepID=A0A0F9C0Y7_9ZZZZ